MEAVDKISVGVSKEKAGQNTQEAITENADGMKVSLGEKICYGVGDIGANLVWTTVASFLTIYCTDVAGIAAGIVGTLMLIARLFDGVSDLFMGIIIDKTNTRWGKSPSVGTLECATAGHQPDHDLYSTGPWCKWKSNLPVTCIHIPCSGMLYSI